MITITEEQHEIDITNTEEVVKLLADALADPNFSGFYAYVTTDWVELKKYKKSFKVTINKRFEPPK